MKYYQNPFNLRTLLPLDIQMLADGGEGTPRRITHHQEMAETVKGLH